MKKQHFRVVVYMNNRWLLYNILLEMNNKNMFEKDLKACLDTILPPEIKEDASQKE